MGEGHGGGFSLITNSVSQADSFVPGLLIYPPDSMLKSAVDLGVIYFGCVNMSDVTGPND